MLIVSYTHLDRFYTSLINLTFRHYRLCVQLFYNPKAISKRKIFSSVHWSPRIISVRSLNAEIQERAFGQANAISKATSNYHPDHIISNVIVRFQVETNMEKQSLLIQQNSILSNLAKALPPFTNTILPSALLETNAAEVQALLEIFRLSITRSWVCWETMPDGGVEFLDSEANTHLNGAQLHHFQSSNMKNWNIWQNVGKTALKRDWFAIAHHSQVQWWRRTWCICISKHSYS